MPAPRVWSVPELKLREIQDANRRMLELLREELTFEGESYPELPGSYRARVRALLAKIAGD